jgi:hypothetical protein
MLWLLITTMGRNPGDEMIRIGIQNLIRGADHQPEYLLLDKDVGTMRKTILSFDKCIWCGMPLFWSDGENRNDTNILWKSFLFGWPSERKNDFLVLGAGGYFPLGVKRDEILYKKELNQSAKDILDRSFYVTARDSVVAEMTGEPIPAFVCPAVFSIMDFRQSNDLKITNLMPYGSHYPSFGPAEALIWKIKKFKIAKILLDNNFLFLAHDLEEYEFARQCGFKKIIPYNGNPCGLLEYYGKCGKFFGNRIHGAIAARGNNADTWCVNYDSRLAAVRLSDAKVTTPSQLNLDELAQWAQQPTQPKPFDMQYHYQKQLEIVRKFMLADRESDNSATTPDLARKLTEVIRQLSLQTSTSYKEANSVKNT